MEIYHRAYNLDAKDNLDLLPYGPAVYAIFALINGRPVNCRHVGHCWNLREAMRGHFERETDAGLRTFMQGPWIKLLLFEQMPSDDEGTLQRRAQEWVRLYQPYCDQRGEYSLKPSSAVCPTITATHDQAR